MIVEYLWSLSFSLDESFRISASISVSGNVGNSVADLGVRDGWPIAPEFSVVGCVHDSHCWDVVGTPVPDGRVRVRRRRTSWSARYTTTNTPNKTRTALSWVVNTQLKYWYSTPRRGKNGASVSFCSLHKAKIPSDIAYTFCALGRNWLRPQRWTACCPPRR